MASTGFTAAGAGVSGSPAGGDDRVWTNPDGVKTDYLLVDNATISAFLGSGTTSKYLKGTTFGFSIPSNHVITGIEFRFQRIRGIGSFEFAKTKSIRLIDDTGAAVGDDLVSEDTAFWPIGFTQPGGEATVGASDNDWNAGLTPAIVNDADFGVAIQCGTETSWSGSIVLVAVSLFELNIHHFEQLAAPTGVTATQSVDDVDVTWTDAATGEENYEVSVSVNGGAYTVLTDSLAAGTTSYKDTTGYPTYPPNATLDYRVRALGTDPLDSDYGNAAQISYTATQRIDLGQALEADVAFAFSEPSSFHKLGTALEASTAQGFTAAKAKALGQATETDQAQAMTVVRSVPLEQTTEADTAQPFTHAKAATLGLVAETDTAQAATAGKAKVLGQAQESGSALAFVVNRAVAIGQAVETSVAFALTRLISIPPTTAEMFFTAGRRVARYVGAHRLARFRDVPDVARYERSDIKAFYSAPNRRIQYHSFSTEED